ncbi:hypothetical protein HGM15179_020430, partial [Zosterops borbonicus]
SRFGALLDMLTDRLSSLCLLLNLALLEPQWAGLLQLSSALDLASHWLHMHWWAGLKGIGGKPLAAQALVGGAKAIGCTGTGGRG